MHTRIAAIAEDQWVPIPYFNDGADVAEISYRPFGTKGKVCRLIVRRTKPSPGSQLALLTTYAYHALITQPSGVRRRDRG
ncbi:MAG: hypothetical protein M3083_04060 [Actinomycetota bacterium]|nr:hypothetical protein [Actinomycetota bacterium]